MNVREYLYQLRRAKQQIRQCKSQLYDLRDIAYGIKAVNADSEKVQSSGGGSKTESAVIAIIEQENRLNELIVNYIQLQNKIIGEINSLEDSRYTGLLFRRYVECKRFERIAFEMGYDYGWTRHLHKRALRAFEGVLGENRID